MAGLYILDLDDTLAYTTRDLQGDPKLIPKLKLVEGTFQFLKWRRRKCVLLTAGYYSEQQRKIEVLGIRKCFKEIIIVSKPEDKPPILTYLVQRFTQGRRKDEHLDPKQVVVIGDRPDIEIRKAQQLGCVTVRMRILGGRHSDEIPSRPSDWTPFETKDFVELLSKYPQL